jgi:arylsulfatase A-like enzyme
LDRLNITDTTLVIFSSDNGPARMTRKVALKRMHDTATGEGFNIAAAKGITGGRKGYKASLFEGGIGVPFIARWPGKIAAGKVDKTSIFSAVDLLPTFCEIAGVKLPADYKPDGISQVATLKGKGQPLREKPLFWKTLSTRPVTRLMPSHWGAYVVVHNNWKLVTDQSVEHVELYDLVKDPLEKSNLAKKHPGEVTLLKKMLTEWQATLPAKPTGKVFSSLRKS